MASFTWHGLSCQRLENSVHAPGHAPGPNNISAAVISLKENSKHNWELIPVNLFSYSVRSKACSPLNFSSVNTTADHRVCNSADERSGFGCQKTNRNHIGRLDSNGLREVTSGTLSLDPNVKPWMTVLELIYTVGWLQATGPKNHPHPHHHSHRATHSKGKTQQREEKHGTK
jgi:hypothetical protein